jgi:PAS domain S-box-containing protein
MAAQKTDQNLKMLEAKCQTLENQCSAYIKALEQTNQRLEREIKRQKRTESKLRASEVRFRKIFEYAPFGACMSDQEGQIVLANKALCSMLGYEKKDLENTHFTEISHTDDIEAELDLFNRLTQGEFDHYRLEKRYQSKQGKIIWGSLAVTWVEGTTSEDCSILGMVEDISKRKQAEAEILKARDDLEDIVAQRTREIGQLKDRLQAENIFLKQELADVQSYGTIIGKSYPIKTVISQIELVAPTDANVLIHGESGTGKELVAREIHKHSSRKEMPLIKVNCATIPKDLYESEFFGHVKGAFTGAVKDRIGRFEAADGGTIFLDEVGEIPLDLQSKLLRILQEGEYERLGEDKTRRVNVRLIAATNKNLANEVKAMRFRDDLYYRLNVFPIHVAPLRERKDDIQLLATHFLKKISKKLNVPLSRLTKANVIDLQSYDWPGNIRELENTIEREIILSRSKTLNFANIKETTGSSSSQPISKAPDLHNPKKILSGDEIKLFERQNTINALERCKWKIYGDDGAALLLNLKPTTLIERMKRMRIRKPKNNSG